jgi:Tol biopolymer transport system component
VADLDDRIREELRRAAVPADPSGVFDRVVVRKVRRHVLRQVGIVGLTIAVIAGSITGAWALSKSFRRSAVQPTPGASTIITPGPTPTTQTPPVPTGTIFFIRGPATGHIPRTFLYSMRPDGSHVKQLTELPMDSFSFAVSPDGRMLAFTRGISEGSGELDVMNVDGSGLRTLTTFGDPQEVVWSPDAKSVLFVTGLSPGAIYLMPANGGTRIRLTHTSLDCADEQPAWSPGATKIAYIHDCPSQGDTGVTWLFVMNADGTNQQRLTDGTANPSRPSWSPDGSRLALGIQTPGSGADVFVISAGGSDLTQLTNDGSSGAPLWSPDGSSIAFDTRRDGNEEIYVMNADGSVQTNITTNPGFDQLLAWTARR